MEPILPFLTTLLIILLAVLFVYMMVKNSNKISDRETSIECRLLMLEQCLLNKLAQKRGIDLDKEFLKAELGARGKFRKRVYEDMLKEFNEDKPKEKQTPSE